MILRTQSAAESPPISSNLHLGLLDDVDQGIFNDSFAPGRRVPHWLTLPGEFSLPKGSTLVYHEVSVADLIHRLER